MDCREYQKLLNARWPYIMMRPAKDSVYHNGVTVKQLRKWRSEWLQGRMFGLVNPAPDYKAESFDCDKEVITYLAHCIVQNARTGKALPMCTAKLGPLQTSVAHSVVCFVERGTWQVGLYDVRADVVHLVDPRKPEYLELV